MSVARSKSYIKGRALEYKVRRELEKLGFRVIRSAGSHTPVDILAFKHGKLIAIQCKMKRHTQRDVNELIAWSKDMNASPVIISKKRGRYVAYIYKDDGSFKEESIASFFSYIII